ncbi:hypothetical protein AL046_03640 [Pseudomonas syringae pv. avii]|nr:hypothetical protein AL046_03640 [Pseudomonas syringae pv. avii]
MITDFKIPQFAAAGCPVLDELPANQQSDQQYLDRIALISSEREQALNEFAIRLSMQIAEAVNMAPQ